MSNNCLIQRAGLCVLLTGCLLSAAERDTVALPVEIQQTFAAESTVLSLELDGVLVTKQGVSLAVERNGESLAGPALQFNETLTDTPIQALVTNDAYRGLLAGTMLVADESITLSGRSARSFSLDGLHLVFDPAGSLDHEILLVGDRGWRTKVFGVDGTNSEFDVQTGQLTISGRVSWTAEMVQALGIERYADQAIGTIVITMNMVVTETREITQEGAIESVVVNTEPTAAGGFPSPGPDVIVGDLPATAQQGRRGTYPNGIVGISVGTTSCNKGDVPFNWFALPNVDHPVIPYNLYRLRTENGSDRFEQIGWSWMKHGFTALQQNICGFGCTSSGTGSLLGVGCSDPYSVGRNGGQCGLGAREQVNPYTGAMPGGPNLGGSPCGSSNYPSRDHRGHVFDGASLRCQVRDSDLIPAQNVGARYFSEAQYVNPHEYNNPQSRANQNMNNNVSYRELSVSMPSNGNYNFSNVGATVREQPAVEAWPGASSTLIEPAFDVDGRAFLYYEVTDIGGGLWHYEYALYNMHLDRAIQSFSVPIPSGVILSNVQFHAPPNHDDVGVDPSEEYSNTPWTFTNSGGIATWETETFAQNTQANAIRFGTLYNFRFDANAPPQNINSTVGFFKIAGSANVATQAPQAVGPQDCNGNGIEDSLEIANGQAQDCNSNGRPDDCDPLDQLRTRRVASGLTNPVGVFAPPGDTDRLFIVEQAGLIKILDLTTETVLPTPYLNVTGITSGGGETGLLSMAFHPDWETDTRFFIYYTRVQGGTDPTVVAEFTASSPSANTANAASRTDLLVIPQDFSNHNGGGMYFGPDGYLYVATGDGGSANDPNNRSQDTSSLLGKMLRLDVDTPGTYSSPAGNPFVGAAGDDEIWAYGLRNPWRFSFDRLTGDIYIGDVGQDAREEIDFEPAGFAGGGNYGWDCKEGSICTPTSSGGFGCSCGQAGLIDPIHEIAHGTLGVCSITGGHVYRGCAIGGLSGTYFFSDLCGNFVRTFRYDAITDTVNELTDRTSELAPDAGFLGQIVSFGEDGDGEMYIVSHSGDIFKIESATGGPQCGDGTVDPGEECDDGNTTPGDGCSATCTNEGCGFCGDGIVSIDEACDDGNNNSGDGCSSTCVTETANACADAALINEGTWAFNTSGATTDGPSHAACAESGDGGATVNDIWFQYIPTCTGQMTIDLCDSTYDTDLVVYDSCTCPTNSSTLLACNDDADCALQYRSRLTNVSVTQGNCYLIRVGGWRNAGDEGPGNMTLSISGGTCNDLCGNGIVEDCEECDDGNSNPADGCDNCVITQSDCDNDGTSDAEEIANCDAADPRCKDCNSNGIPDGCEYTDDPGIDCAGGPIGSSSSGMSLFVANNCLFCHSADGSGGTGPDIRDKTRVEIWNKIGPYGAHPGSQFPQFTLTDYANLEAFLAQGGSRGRPDFIPDECQSGFANCDGDSIPDACELENGTQVDINYNGVPDDCDGCVGDGDCDDGSFCNGAEICDNESCVAGSDPCPGQLCDEGSDACVDCLDSGDCDDGLFCNGAETCSGGTCQSGSSPCGVGQFCIESADECVDCIVDAHCDDGAFCNGAETCVNDVCVSGSDPCPGLACDDGADTCLCDDNGDCDDGVFCNGAEFCDGGGQCQDGAAPCNPGDICDEDGENCLSASRMFLVPAGTDPSATTPGENMQLVVDAGDRMTLDVYLENQAAPMSSYDATFACNYASSEGALGATFVDGSSSVDIGRSNYVFAGTSAFPVLDQGQCDESIPCSASKECPPGNSACVDTNSDDVPDTCSVEPPRLGGVSLAGDITFTEPRYLGSIQFDFPTSARGQYAMGFVCTPDDGCQLTTTLVQNASLQALPFTSDGLIVTIAVGRCCLQDDGDPQLECFELTSGECAGLGGAFTAGQDCSGDDPCGCQSDCDCVFPFQEGVSTGSDTCLQQTCGPNGCEEFVTRYGDIIEPFGGLVQTSDILCAVAAFGSYCDCPNADIAGCVVSGVPVGTDDILAVVDAFGGLNPCGCEVPMGGTSAASSEPAIVFDAPVHSVSPDAPATIALVPQSRRAVAGGTVSVDVFVEGVSQMSGYELGLTAGLTGGTRRLGFNPADVSRVSIDSTRSDFVFVAADNIPLTDEQGGRLGAVSLSGGADVTGGKVAYLGTFEVTVPQATGQLTISLDAAVSGLWKSSIESIAMRPIKPVVITVVQSEMRLGSR